MNAIILNTRTGAVSEYSNFDVNSITSNFAGSSAGLRKFGGSSDAGSPIVAQIITGKKLWGTSMKKAMQAFIYLALNCSGRGEVTVFGRNDSWTYVFPSFPDGEARCQSGRGLRENYLAFGYRNIDGDDFQLDQIEIPVSSSKNRRV